MNLNHTNISLLIKTGAMFKAKRIHKLFKFLSSIATHLFIDCFITTVLHCNALLEYHCFITCSSSCGLLQNLTFLCSSHYNGFFSSPSRVITSGSYSNPCIPHASADCHIQCNSVLVSTRIAPGLQVLVSTRIAQGLHQD